MATENAASSIHFISTVHRGHPEENPKVWKLRESNIRCPVAGAAGLKLCQAAYAYRTFECPWQYHANTSYTDPMGCWRPSTGFK